VILEKIDQLNKNRYGGIISYQPEAHRGAQTSANAVNFSIVFASTIFGGGLPYRAMVKNPSILSLIQMLIRITTKKSDHL